MSKADNATDMLARAAQGDCVELVAVLRSDKPLTRNIRERLADLISDKLQDKRRIPKTKDETKVREDIRAVRDATRTVQWWINRYKIRQTRLTNRARVRVAPEILSKFLQDAIKKHELCKRFPGFSLGDMKERIVFEMKRRPLQRKFLPASFYVNEPPRSPHRGLSRNLSPK